ncbi:MAG: glycosyltransferase family 4 protein [Desulfobacteraceae bacterium]|nr:glycosyltransferase family 4 protein [Desulfobacteraceae bacterium]
MLLGGGGAWFVSRYGLRFNIMDVANERSSHSGSIPKGGGVGILSAFVFMALILRLPLFFWIPCLVISLLSFWGDRQELSVKLRLIIQFGCALVAMIAFLSSKAPAFLLLLPFAVVFIVGTANIYNFMDGIDGIAGITSVVGFGTMAFYGSVLGADQTYIVLSAGMALASFGFLFFNLPKAKVFMGDVGSVLAGFVYALMSIFIARDFIDFICMAGFILPFYLDEFTTICVRLRLKESLAKPHRRHIYQIMVNEMGFEHWKVSVLYGAVQAMICCIVIFIKSKGVMALFSCYAMLGLVFILLSLGIRRKAVN